MYRKIILWSLLPLIVLLGLLAFDRYWELQAATAVNEPVVDEAALTSGMAKVRQWERLVEADPPRANRQFSAEFSVAELQAIIRDAENKKSNPSILPGSLKVFIVDQEITVQGIVRRPINFPLNITMTAGVKDGLLVPEIISARFGWWRFSSKYINNLANEILGQTWQADLNRPSFVWDELSVTDDRLYFAGHTTGQFYK